jgi:hypothetical protein
MGSLPVDGAPFDACRKEQEDGRSRGTGAPPTCGPAIGRLFVTRRRPLRRRPLRSTLQAGQEALFGFPAAASVLSTIAARDRQSSHEAVKVYDLSIPCREAGPANAPTLFLLRGLPPSSRMYQPLFARLAGQFHLLAPDYPGFGRSDVPNPQDFAYTLDHFAKVIGEFTKSMGAPRYILYVGDYGALVGFRLSLAHEDGLGLSLEARRQFWQDRATHEGAFRCLKVAEERRQADSAEARWLNVLITPVESVGDVVVQQSAEVAHVAECEINLCARLLPVTGVSR